jgi:hypothetical protein
VGARRGGRVFIGGTAFNRKYAVHAGKVPGIYEERVWVSPLKTLIRNWRIKPSIACERDTRTVVLK